MGLLLARAGLAEASEESLRQLEYFFCLISLTPAIVYFIGVGLWWMFAKQSRTLGRLAVLILPGLAWMLFFVAWPSWWLYPQ